MKLHVNTSVLRAVRIGLAVFAVTLLAGCKVELNSNLPEQEANAMMAKLLAEGVEVSKVSDGEVVTLMVNSQQFGRAVEILESHGLPERSFSTMGDVFADEGLVASPLQEWARFNYAKAQELSQSISSIPGVVKADVHIASSRQQTPFDETPPPGASVLIQMQSDKITPELVPQIKQLVTFSIPDIEYERVGVIVSPITRPQQQVGMVSFLGVVMPEESAKRVRVHLLGLGGGGLALVVLTGLGAFLLGRRRAGPRPEEA